MTELELWVNGMTCAHCERAVAAELFALPTVVDVRVDAVTGRVQLRYDGLLSRDLVRRAIEDAGYELRSWATDHDE